MATGRGRREGLDERLRGAGRINLNDDDTFKIDLPGGIIAPPIQSSSSPGSQPALPATRADRTIPIVEEIPEEREESPEQPPGGDEDPGRSSSTTGSASSRRDDPESDEPEPVRPPSSVSQPRGPPLNRNITEEITESPVGKPGSGHRVRIDARQFEPKVDSTSEDEQEEPSSPSANRVQRSNVSARPRPSIPAVPEESEEEEEPEDNRIQFQRPQRPQPVVSEEEEEPEQSDHSDEEALEIDAKDAAKSIAHKRPRPSVQKSPSLGSEEEEESSSDDAEETRATKRTRKSPAIQKQPTKRPKSSPRKKRRRSYSSDENEHEVVEITVQRFVNNFTGDADGEDELQQEIPFANRGGETVVDVFAQVCEDVISAVLKQFEGLLESAKEKDKQKEYRIKMRAIAAYGEELNSRLLQHAIHLNHWHSLRRRLRHVQKEKLALRDEIIRLKGEREQVALRMDAIRIKHEADSKESTSRLNASSLMHDIDLAVEQGRATAELSFKDEKEADLRNLDLVLAQISDQVSSSSSTGGLLQQVQDFNAFLERAVAALESG